MIIMGIDPGLGTTGYGVIEIAGQTRRYKTSGTVRTTPSTPGVIRLTQIIDKLRAVISDEKVQCIAVESGYVGRNAQTALKLGQARAAALLSGQLEGADVFEYAPREVKMALTGRGSADKSQVQFIVEKILGITFDDGEEDISDALALAICHSMRSETPLAKTRTRA
jgi:crossover junction endodeoxyribonuclease RuvC